MRCAGVDGFNRGWVAVVGDTRFLEIVAHESLTGLLDIVAWPDVVAIDIPLGLPTVEPRRCDAEVRTLLGARRSSLFETAPRSVLEADTYAEARARSVALRGRSLSSQSYNLRGKIFEADQVIAGTDSLFEVHPEVCFVEMTGAPLRHTKKSWSGLQERLRALQGGGIVLPPTVRSGVAVPIDDVVDAGAALWSAWRIARGNAVPVPDPPEVLDGRRVAIWR